MSDSLLSAFDDSYIEVGYMFDRIFYEDVGSCLKFNVKRYSDRFSYSISFRKEVPVSVFPNIYVMIIKIVNNSNITVVYQNKFKNEGLFNFLIEEHFLPKDIDTKFIFKFYLDDSNFSEVPRKLSMKDFVFNNVTYNKNNKLIDDVIPSICVRCGSSGDLRKLKVDCGYDLSESTAFKKSDKKNSGYYVTICKDCRSKFITLLRAWL